MILYFMFLFKIQDWGCGLGKEYKVDVGVLFDFKFGQNLSFLILSLVL